MVLTVVVTMLAAAEPMGEGPVIALAPVGDVGEKAVAALTAVLHTTFGCEVVTAAKVPLPPSAYDRARWQYLSTALLDSLAKAKRPEWERFLGVADVDLYVPQLNFVFGEGDLHRGVAVFSLARLRPDRGGTEASEQLFQRRAATEAIHELGHTYGLSHCSNPQCVMWFSNTLTESDRKGTRFCQDHGAVLARARMR